MWLAPGTRTSFGEQEPARPPAFPFEPLLGGNRGTRGRADGMQSPCHHAELWRQLPLGSSDPCLSLVADRPGPGRGSFAPWVEPQLATYLRPWDRTPPRPALGTW